MIAKANHKRKSVSSRQWAILTACGCFLLAIIWLSREFGLWNVLSRNSSPQLESSNSEFVRSGMGELVLRGPGGRCRGYRYDNVTSETIPYGKPCEITVQRDATSQDLGDAPRRLDALRKSFTGQ